MNMRHLITLIESVKPIVVEDDDQSMGGQEMIGPKVLYRSVSLPELKDINFVGSIRGKQNRFNDFDQRRWVFFGDAISDDLIFQGEETERQAVVALDTHDIHREFKELAEETSEIRYMLVAAIKAFIKKDDANRIAAELEPRPPIDPEQFSAFEKGSTQAERYFRELTSFDRGLATWWRKLKDLGAQRDALQDKYRGLLGGKHSEIVAARGSYPITSAIIQTKPVEGGMHFSDEHGHSGMDGDEFGFFPGDITWEDIDKVMFVKDGAIIGECEFEDLGAKLREFGIN